MSKKKAKVYRKFNGYANGIGKILLPGAVDGQLHEIVIWWNGQKTESVFTRTKRNKK